MSNHCIYKIQNKLNGKVYIGQTNNLKRRNYEHKHYNSLVIDKAITKYGWDNFNIKLLKENLTLQEANDWEIYFINEIYNSYKGNKGYNCNLGGDAKYNREEYKCIYCGKKYIAQKTGRNKYCSVKCRSTHRREQKLDYEERICEICGGKFEARKDTPSTTCSPKCSNKIGYLNNKEKYGGENHFCAKLSLDDCFKIYKRYRINNEKITHKELAKEYEVSRDTISLIVNLNHWSKEKILERW